MLVWHMAIWSARNNKIFNNVSRSLWWLVEEVKVLHGNGVWIDWIFSLAFITNGRGIPDRVLIGNDYWSWGWLVCQWGGCLCCFFSSVC
jgi:hypothetical protein